MTITSSGRITAAATMMLTTTVATVSWVSRLRQRLAGAAGTASVSACVVIALYLPLEGGGRPRERSERGRVGVNLFFDACLAIHPTPLACASLRRATLPLQGSVGECGTVPPSPTALLMG